MSIADQPVYNLLAHVGILEGSNPKPVSLTLRSHACCLISELAPYLLQSYIDFVLKKVGKEPCNDTQLNKITKKMEMNSTID